MADECIEIELDSIAPCPEDLAIGSLLADLILVNKTDVAPAGITKDGEGKVTTVELVSGTKGFHCTGFRVDFSKSEEVINLGMGPNKLKHGLKFVIYARTQAMKNNVVKMINASLLAFVKYKGGDDDSIEMMGEKCGLSIVPGSIRDSTANSGYFTITLATLEGDFETELPPTVGGTYAAGITIFDGLLEVAP